MAEKAGNVTFLSTDGTSNTKGMLCALTTTHAVFTVPESLKGRFVEIMNESTTATDYADFFFSRLATAEVDTSIAAAGAPDGGQSPKLGQRIWGTQTKQGRVPYCGSDVKLYLVAEASASLSLRVILAEQ